MSKSLEPLLSIARQGVPFTAGDGQPFVRLTTLSGGFFILPVRSRAYRDWFFNQFYCRYDTLPSAYAFHAILNHLEAQASENGENTRLSVFRRVGARGSGLFPEQILLDLANPERQYVEISPAGWRVTAEANALLQTSRSSAPLTVPASSPGDALATLRSCLNLSGRADWLRCLAWLLSTLRPYGPFPILILQGPPSSGKTLAARILRCLIDPSTSTLSPTPSSVRDLQALARHNWILALDHISELSLPLTDTLCRLSSGLGAAVREIPRGTTEPLLQYYKRPVLLTVTDHWSPPADLAERSLTLTFPALPPDRRRPEAALFTDFFQAWPAILAALCAAVSTALTRLPELSLPSGRCADALAWAMAAVPSLGCTEDELQQAFAPPEPPHPLVEAIRTLLRQRPYWTGSATELLGLCNLGITPKDLSKQLRSCAMALADCGIELQFRRRHRGVRIIELRGDALRPKSSQSASPDSGLPPHPSQTESLICT